MRSLNLSKVHDQKEQPMASFKIALLLVALLNTSVISAVAQDDISSAAAYQATAKTFSPNLQRTFPDNLLWGDTHLHTSFSFDAGMVGNRLGPDAAYRFARGQTVTASLGMPARLRVPLDFLAVSDHAESLGLAPAIAEENPMVLEDINASRMRDLILQGEPIAAYKMFAQLRARGENVLHRDDLRQTMWQRMTAAAENNYRPGVFTALIAYEYTSALQTNNLHRVVMFRDGAERTNKIIPFSANESPDPEQLWDWMADYETAVGGEILAIPHNGNLSNGLMFADTRANGEPIDAAYAIKRARWEPLYEATQIKGDGEAHPLLSPDDEFADFWTWDRGNFGFAPKTPDMLPAEYARSALKKGIAFEASIGVNPFKFGMIGSTDSHTSLATAEEDNFFSKASPAEPGAGDFRYRGPIIQLFPGKQDISVQAFESAAGGLVAAWATENTREGVFDAFKRREVYASTGPRISLRVFGGFEFDSEDHWSPDLAALGYQKGVPMGSDLQVSAANQKFQLLIVAAKEANGANLDRIQIVKGWVDAEGVAQERVFDAVWAGTRKLNSRGSLPAIGSTVTGATYTNAIGKAILSTVWQDPAFNPKQRAFYYVRVLEIPTPTWLAYDKAHFGDLITLPKSATLSHQERAYSSPIWVAPLDS